MSKHPRRVPAVEQPTEQAHESPLEKLEEDFLEKQSRSAAYRAVVEHNQHLAALNSRINVLQSKLDQREEELHIALPRVAELEQAERTSKIATAVKSLGAGSGAVLLSLASFQSSGSLKFGLLGAGIAAATLAVFTEILFALFGWPQKRPRDSRHS